MKEITKLEKTSLSDFTLCGAELLPKLLKQLEERKNSVLPALHPFINCLCRRWRHVWKCEGNVNGNNLLSAGIGSYFLPGGAGSVLSGIP